MILLYIQRQKIDIGRPQIPAMTYPLKPKRYGTTPVVSDEAFTLYTVQNSWQPLNDLETFCNCLMFIVHVVNYQQFG